jgi:tetratricopeptide (TPR) repeat protein
MMDVDRALAPLEEARPAIDRLDTYSSPQELTEALEAIGQAVERSLRQLLRLDASFDDIRLTAQDPAPPYDRVISLLRQRERIRCSSGTKCTSCGGWSGGGWAGARGGCGRAGCVARLRMRCARGAGEQRWTSRSERNPCRGERGELRSRPALRRGDRPGAVAVALGCGGWALAWYIGARLRSPSELDQGVTAFEQGRLGIAEQHFRSALQEEESATAELYLGRILRRQGRQEEAAAVLNAARKRYPDDADILRELGHLLAVDLNRPAPAAEAYRRAVELEPEDVSNWIALVRALRAAGDPAAETWLARAPADAQAVLKSDRP